MAGLTPEGSQFDANLYDSKFSEIQSEGQDLFTSFDEVYESFNSMGLKLDLLSRIYSLGFKKPYAIQQRGIVPFCKGLDVIQQTPFGTGKTTTFCLGILQRLDFGSFHCQAVVLAPTRELALQIQKLMRALGRFLYVKVHACVGGCEDQFILSLNFVNSPVHVVVGTPGQVYDLLQSRSLCRNSINMLVLDEADEMLSRGCKDQIYDIFRHMPSDVQVGVFSATMPPEALAITRKFMKKPLRILLKCDPPRNPSPPYMSAKGRRLFPAPLGECFLNELPDSLIKEFILRLPDSLINEIILHLPSSSVLGFFSISKPWFSSTTSHYFLRRWGHQFAPFYHDPPLAFLIQDCYTPTKRDFFLCSGVPDVKISGFSLDFLPISRFDRTSPYMVVGSCEDLMLCCNKETWQSEYFVVNPITHHLDAVNPSNRHYKNVLVGFVCEPASIAEARKGGELQYSVVRIPVSQVSTTKFRVDIFTSKDRQWKAYVMTLTEELTTESCIRFAVACNGSLYWHFNNFGVKVMALDPFNPTEKGIHVIQNGPDRFYLQPKNHVLGFCQGKLRMSEMLWSEDENHEALRMNIWELEDSKAKWQLVHEVQLQEILAANSSIVRPRSAVGGSWGTLAFHPCNSMIFYFYLECNEIHSVICCNLEKKSLKIESGNDLNKAFGSSVDVIPFLLPQVPTPLPAF